MSTLLIRYPSQAIREAAADGTDKGDSKALLLAPLHLEKYIEVLVHQHMHERVLVVLPYKAGKGCRP